MPDYEKLQELASECGFTSSAPLDVATLIFLPEVRDMCATDKCNRYNHSWSCPPACGSLEDMREKVKAFTSGLLVQTVGHLEDNFDWETLEETAKKQKESFEKMQAILKKEYPRLIAMGTGGCTICETCTYPDAPCRFPDRLTSSMEACGLLVSQVCTDNNLKYNHGPLTIAYTGCFLLQ